MTREIVFFAIASLFAAAFLLAIAGMLADIALMRIRRALGFLPRPAGSAGIALSKPWRRDA